MSEELIRRSSPETRQLVSAVARNLTTESWTDVVLYSKERVPLHLHRVVLSRSPLLHSLLSSLSCCRGLCAHQATLHILLPDVPFEILTAVVVFLYNGDLDTREEDRLAVLVCAFRLATDRNASSGTGRDAWLRYALPHVGGEQWRLSRLSRILTQSLRGH